MDIRQELPKTLQELKEVKDKVEILMRTHEQFRCEEKESKKILRQEIEKFKKQMIGLLDELEKASLRDLKLANSTINYKLQTEIMYLESLHTKYDMYINQLEKPNRSKIDRCREIKAAQSFIDAGNNAFPTPTQHPELKFKPNTVLLQHLGELRSLGTLENNLDVTEMVEHNCMTILPKSISVMSQSPASSKSGSASNDSREKQIGLYKVIMMHEYNVKLANDQLKCHLNASCIFITGEVVLADRDNKNLKILDKNMFQVLRYYTLPVSPTSVCCLSSNQVAVSLTNRSIQCVCIGEQQVRNRTLRMRHNCEGIAVSHDNLYVLDGILSVHVYTLDGMLLKTITDEHSAQKCSPSSRIALNDEGTVVYVADWQMGLIAMNIDGHVLWKHSEPDLKYIRDICIDGDGNILVCSMDSPVVQFDKDGKKLGEVIFETPDALQNLSLCLDRNTNQVVITHVNSDKICVYQLE